MAPRVSLGSPWLPFGFRGVAPEGFGWLSRAGEAARAGTASVVVIRGGVGHDIEALVVGSDLEGAQRALETIAGSLEEG
jgi:hypothetical protein